MTGREKLMRQQFGKNKKKDKKNQFKLTIKKYDIRDKEARKTKVNPKEIARRATQIKEGVETGAKWFKKNITDKTKNTRISPSQPVGSQTKETKTGVQPSKKQQQKATTTTTTAKKAKDTGGTSDSDRKAWLKKTSKSAASKAFTPEERWKIQKALREKKKAKLSIKNGK